MWRSGVLSYIHHAGNISQVTNMTATHRKPNQYESLLAGIIAGGVEGAATYPAEFVKTRAQFTATKGAVSISFDSSDFRIPVWCLSFATRLEIGV